jgi:hypothetical protein
VWFDNKNIYASIAQIGTIAACSTIDLSVFAVGSGDCSAPWPAPLEGVAYDEYIEEGNFTHPSDNFGGYTLEIMKAGGGWHSLTIPGPDGPPPPPPPPVIPPWSGPTVGTLRVGDPGMRCANPVPPLCPTPPCPVPSFSNGVLAWIDMRRLDSVCNTTAADADLVLQRATVSSTGEPLTPGECCGFIIHLTVWDTTICPSIPGNHVAEWYAPFCICNDLPPIVVP